MRKKLIVLVLLIALVPFSLCADFLELGMNLGYSKGYSAMGGNSEFWDWRNISYGPDLKINIFFLRLDFYSQIAPLADGIVFDNNIGLDLYFKVEDFIRISAGVGISMPIVQKNGEWYIGYYGSSHQAFTGFKELVENSHLTYRIGLGFIINDTMEIDLKYSVPATGSFREDNYVPSWENSALTLGLSFILV